MKSLILYTFAILLLASSANAASKCIGRHDSLTDIELKFTRENGEIVAADGHYIRVSDRSVEDDVKYKCEPLPDVPSEVIPVKVCRFANGYTGNIVYVFSPPAEPLRVVLTQYGSFEKPKITTFHCN